MLYLNSDHIQSLGVAWSQTVDAIEHAVKALGREDFAQPIKPYLRFGDPVNRIIAMPAYLGEPAQVAGIKWIASFPKNIRRGIQRAHSVTILNRHDTGEPFATFNTAYISGIRTASVSGLVIRHVGEKRSWDRVKVGIIGFGPIGRLHLEMVRAALGDAIEHIRLFDLRPIANSDLPDGPYPIEVVSSWQEAYRDADVFMTCTVADAPYIDLPPKPGALLLNVSLRDFKPEIMHHTQWILVDDWDEVCREKTDIETMHLTYGLRKEDTRSLVDMVCAGALEGMNSGDTVMFNPMGMAIFDMAIAKYYFQLAVEKGVGIDLP